MRSSTAVQGVNASAVDTIAASARDALGQVASALNTQDGGVYVFAGQDTANPPVPGNILTSDFFTADQYGGHRPGRQRRGGDSASDI